MTYFRELPDIEYQSPLSDKISSKSYVRAKNLFRRVKLRDDLQNVFTLFNKYQIPEGARPETVAEELYGSAEYDWVVLLSGGIVSVRDDWPLSDRDIYRFAEQKYGIEKLNDIKYYETIEVKDSSGRLILPGGKIVDNYVQIPIPTNVAEIQGLINSQVFNINTNNNTVSGNLLYLYDENNVTNTQSCGSFTFTSVSSWFYTLDEERAKNLNFSEGVAVAEDSIFYISQDGYRRTITIKTTVTEPQTENEPYEYEFTVNQFSDVVSYVSYYDSKLGREVTQYDVTKGITNYEYEVLQNNEKRGIYLLKPAYLQQYVNDLRAIMFYEKSSQYVSKKLARTENTAITSP